MEILIFIIIYAAFFYGIFKLAKSKNREPGGWMLASIIISPIIIIVILAIMQTLPGKKKRITKRKKVSKSETKVKFLYEFSDFTFNSKLRILRYKNEEDVKLSPKENELLKLLLNHLNDLMPRELALIKIWNDDNYFTSRSMDVYIAKIRKYLQKDDKLEIENIHGEGFRLIARK